MITKKIIKNIIKPIIPNSIRREYRVLSVFKRIHSECTLIQLWRKGTIILSEPSINRMDDYVRQMEKSFEKILIDTKTKYIYPYDSWIWREVPLNYKVICSITVDFEKVLCSNLNLLKQNFEKCKDRGFAKRQVLLIQAIEDLAIKISTQLQSLPDNRAKVLGDYFPSMLYRVPRNLDEAIQKLLFYNALFWQANHWHVGLGRLDKVLYSYYENDLNKGLITKNQAKELIKDLINILGKDTKTKSKTLIGDTGQYILLGGLDRDGKTINNDLSEIFLDVFKEYKHTDPKLILRVNNNTSDSIWSKAVECVSNGNGSPLFMNETPIMRNMVDFGYAKDDVCQLGTSACWEPLIIGKSFDQNNTLPCIIALKPLSKTISEYRNLCTFEAFLTHYKKNLSIYIESLIFDIQYDCSPLFTLFFDDCLEKEKDFTEGGARYAYHGIQVLSLPNTINSLLNVKQYVYEKKILSLEKLNAIIQSNYEGFIDYYDLFRSNSLKYGSTKGEVIELTNDLMTFIGDEVGKHIMNCKPVKVGFSSPNYIMSCKGVEASLDGRKADEPFAVHISPLSSDIDISEIMDFATHLNYEKNRINGNVVDFTIPPSYINNKEKLVTLIKNSCKKGLFELQLNVLNYKQLKDAKEHPDKYPSLIVRVWGFSAYFNDLPELYKDTLIERARLYESA